MKIINYTMFVKQVNDDLTWEEPMSEYVEDNVTPEQRAKQIIKSYNDTLRPKEIARELVKVTVKGEVESDKKYAVIPINHIWKKKSLVTEKGGYDKYVCEVCGATGKRYGLGATITIDKRYIKRQNDCPGKK